MNRFIHLLWEVSGWKLLLKIFTTDLEFAVERALAQSIYQMGTPLKECNYSTNIGALGMFQLRSTRERTAGETIRIFCTGRPIPATDIISYSKANLKQEAIPPESVKDIHNGLSFRVRTHFAICSSLENETNTHESVHSLEGLWK